MLIERCIDIEFHLFVNIKQFFGWNCTDFHFNHQSVHACNCSVEILFFLALCTVCIVGCNWESVRHSETLIAEKNFYKNSKGIKLLFSLLHLKYPLLFHSHWLIQKCENDFLLIEGEKKNSKMKVSFFFFLFYGASKFSGILSTHYYTDFIIWFHFNYSLRKIPLRHACIPCYSNFIMHLDASV